MPTPRPDSAPTPGAAQPARPGAGTGDGEAPGVPGEARTVRLSRSDLGAPDPEATVRLDSASVPDADRTVRLDRGAAPVPLGAPDPEATVRLDSASVPDADRTVRLDRGAAPVPLGAPDPEAESATFLDPRVWGGAPRPGESATIPEVPPSPDAGADASVDPGTTRADLPSTDLPSDERPFATGELRRFGPGVPPQAAAAWHGEAAAGRPQPRRTRRWLVPVAVLLAVLAFLFWRFHTPALAVTAVGVTTDLAGPGCGGTAVVTAAVETNGGSGTIRYRWLRSDGTTSDEIVQDVRSGTHHTDLVLRWTFDGHGSLQATATLEILSPAPRTAAVSFPYHCP